MHKLYSPSALTLDTEGNLYVCDNGNRRIRKVTNGIITTIAGGSSLTAFVEKSPALGQGLYGVTAIAVGPAGTVYVAHPATFSVYKISNGILRRVVWPGMPTDLPSPKEEFHMSTMGGMAIDAAGTIYISDSTWNIIHAIKDGVARRIAGTGERGSSPSGTAAVEANLYGPTSLLIGPDGALHFTQTGGALVSRIKDGILTHTAGTGVPGYSGDGGPAISAQLKSPGRVSVDSTGTIWICDYLNNRVRRIMNGTISTVAGGGVIDLDGAAAIGAQLWSIESVAVSPEGKVYFSSGTQSFTLDNGQIRRFAGSATSGDNGDGGPAKDAHTGMQRAVAIGPDGSLFIADSSSYRIRRVSGGLISTVAGNGTRGTPVEGASATGSQVGAPSALAVSSGGEIYFWDNRSEIGGKAIWKVTAAGTLTRVAGGGDGDPLNGNRATATKLDAVGGLAVDRQGYLYFSHTRGSTYGTIFKVVDGFLVTVAGGGQEWGVDGAAATRASLVSPRGLSVDASGRLYFVEGTAATVRMVENGVIRRIGGTFTHGFNGESGPADALQFHSPGSLAAAADGSVYVADASNFRLRKLTPVGEPCTYTADVSRIDFPVEGGTQTVRIDTQAGCPWTATRSDSQWVLQIEPAEEYSYPHGNGPAVLQVHADRNWDEVKRTTLVISGVEIPVTQSSPGCKVELTMPGYSFSPAGGVAQFQLRTPQTCAWTIQNNAGWVGMNSENSMKGPREISVMVAANEGGPRQTVVQFGGVPFTVTQAGANPPSGGSSGIFAHLAAGESWTTSITLHNKGTALARVRLNFYLKDTTQTSTYEAPVWIMPLEPGSLPASLGVIERSLRPGESFILESLPASENALYVGWATLQSDGDVDGFAVFRQTIGERVQEAVTPLEKRDANAYTLWFDNTDGYATGMAIARSGEKNGTVELALSSDSGAALTKETRADSQGSLHSSFNLPWEFEAAFDQRGTIKTTSSAPSRLGVLGLRFNPKGSFTSVPPLTAESGGGTMPQIASGGGWTTTVTLVNTGAAAATASLHVFDSNGAALPLAWNAPQHPGDSPGTSSMLQRTLQPGEAWVVETTGPDWEPAKTGWARLNSTGGVGGFAVFKQQIGDAVQEAVVPVEPGVAKRYAVWFDNRDGYSTGIAIANLTASARTFAVVVRDETGLEVGSESVALGPHGHTSFSLETRFMSTVARRGIVEFIGADPGEFSVLGLRFHSRGAFTTMPAMGK